MNPPKKRLLISKEMKQAESGPSWRPAQGSNRVKCYNYANDSIVKIFESKLQCQKIPRKIPIKLENRLFLQTSRKPSFREKLKSFSFENQKGDTSRFLIERHVLFQNEC